VYASGIWGSYPERSLLSTRINDLVGEQDTTLALQRMCSPYGLVKCLSACPSALKRGLRNSPNWWGRVKGLRRGVLTERGRREGITQGNYSREFPKTGGGQSRGAGEKSSLPTETAEKRDEYRKSGNLI